MRDDDERGRRILQVGKGDRIAALVGAKHLLHSSHAHSHDDVAESPATKPDQIVVPGSGLGSSVQKFARPLTFAVGIP